MHPDKACAVVLSSTPHQRILLFRHPLAGVQLVKGTIEPGETPGQAALRELAEESGINAATIRDELGCWEAGHQGQVWSFHLCRVSEPLPERWSHQTLDDHGHCFEFFWAALDRLPHAECHPVFRRALDFVSASLRARGHLPDTPHAPVEDATP
ncbi:NUDIX domain-containing protein [Pseudomonas sp. BJa5]|uniref:NUDIX hydrolase n=1 Tax=Pseudomonas sp. BJa5 TaxID=2936270 RepID=UPI002559D44E|nr:NUDIX domain-containing protein [Pseudomonas sp. BGr12]MDL2419822.1 NUDIX domain-containing protein [Pseudomonas sp. BGr12]